MRVKLLALVAITGLFGCKTTEDLPDCLLVGYVDGVSVWLDGDRSIEGTYELAFSEGERTWALCTFEVPQPEDQFFRCTGEADFWGQSWQDTDSLMLTVMPEQFTVSLTRDEALVAEETFTPQYEITEPNGEGCGEHIFARVDFSW